MAKYQYTVTNTYEIEAPNVLDNDGFLDFLAEEEDSFDAPRELIEYEVIAFTRVPSC